MKGMSRQTQNKLVANILRIEKPCHLRIGVWYPTISEIKKLLDMGHAKIRRTSSTIFGIEHEHADGLSFGAVSVVLYCNELEGEFMEKVYKKGKEVSK
ncbi:MAG: hypothetical protein IMF19_16365 [Proteobacteria bacterium]|nr:hypothetical protein [Pseudomonadota bacterium]